MELDFGGVPWWLKLRAVSRALFPWLLADLTRLPMKLLALLFKALTGVVGPGLLLLLTA